MKAIFKCLPYQLLMIILLSFLFVPIFAQSEFKGQILTTSPKNDKVLRKNFKEYKIYELNLAEIKLHIRKNKGDIKKPIEFSILLGDEKLKLSLFENDIFDDSYFEIVNGIKKTKNTIEINTYAGFVGDNPSNALRLFISDKRISGVFKYNNIDFVIRNLTDYDVVERGNANKFEIIVAKADNEISRLEPNFCGNSKISKKGRITDAGYPGYTVPCGETSSIPNCKYIKIKVASDPSFMGSKSNQAKSDIIIDYINQIDMIMFHQLNLRIKLAWPPQCFDNTNNPFSPSTTTNINTAFLEYTSKRNQVFGNADEKIIEYYLSGRGFGYNQGNIPKDQMGQSEVYSLGRSGRNAAAFSTNTKFSGGEISYTETYLVMAHEIGHTIGANHTSDLGYSCSPVTIMCDIPGKIDTYHSFTKTEIQCYFMNHSGGLFSSTISPGFSNIFNVKLNGSSILTTPIFINQNAKIIDLDSSPYTLNPASTSYTANDSRVYFYYKYPTSARFEIRNAPNFLMTITASDQCNYYYRTIPFIYSPSGARLSIMAFPNPTNEDITLSDVYEDSESDNNSIKTVDIYSKDGDFIKNMEIIHGPIKSKVIVNTRYLENGLYYFRIIRADGSVETKRIAVEH